MKQYSITKITNVFDHSYLRQYLLLISQLVIFLISKVLSITHISSANDTHIPGIIYYLYVKCKLLHIS